MSGRLLRLCRVFCTPVLLTGLGIATEAAAQEQSAPPVTVTVVTLEASDVLLTTPLPGRVTASATAEVRPQVNGLIIERLFEEGRPVKEGDALYRIDPATYEAYEAAAEASLAQAQAQLASAEREVKRQETLLERSVSSQTTYDDADAARDVAAAAVKVAQANLLAAKIDLERTTIRAPISGVAGLSQVTEGALVTSGQATPLTVVRNLDPINVDVTQSATEILRWQRSAQALGEDARESAVLTLRLADGTTYDHTGHLAAAEPQVNQQTGVILLRLGFPNPDQFLLPGMYVQVEVPQAKVEEAILAPQEGVTRDRRGRPMAMVVTPENIVEARQLTIERDQDSSWVVTEGLKPGDRIVVAGLQKIAVGQQVVAEERAPDQPAAQEPAPKEPAAAN